MSVQFGRWNFDGRPVDPEYLEKAGDMLAPYGPDGEYVYIKDSVGILFYPFHTTKESKREVQPCLLPSGAVLTWDGRLDNRADLIGELKDSLTSSATDAEIVATAYEKWGTDCLARLLGDWALAIWNPSSRTLLLAKDFVGARHLSYSVERGQITWSSILDPLVLLAGKIFTLEEEYIAGWLSFFPATHLTPYVGIHAVPPSCFVRITPRGIFVHKYWEFDPKKRIRYHTDGEYEEHFRQVFGEAVRRRLCSDSPVLAELSGGMDSSSIVCMADEILARGEGETPRLDTVSYYDDSEPSWDERRYFAKVEEQRGRQGCHIDLRLRRSFNFNPNGKRFEAIPGSNERFEGLTDVFADCLKSRGTQVVLSGIGGDEVMGGVPNPAPQLEDLIAQARFGELARQLRVWALNKRKPWIHLLTEALRGFLPSTIIGVPSYRRSAPWLHRSFVKRNRSALRGYDTGLKLFGPLPSIQENLSTLNGLRRYLGCRCLQEAPPFEWRYPYLDRNLLEFAYAIPREQIVRPGHRRSLMRRALAGIVPSEILDRKRKGHVLRAPLIAVSTEWDALVRMGQQLLTESLGFVHAEVLLRTLNEGRQGRMVPTVALLRTIALEKWLSSLASLRLLNGGHSQPQRSRTGLFGAGSSFGAARSTFHDGLDQLSGSDSLDGARIGERPG
jgi:asparagine synthase (glutamine-hydrolysing)